MATYIALRQTFVGGRLVQVGDAVEFATTPPADVFVLASSNKPTVERPVSVARDPRFVHSSLEVDERGTRQPSPSRRTHDIPVERVTPTTLDGRSPRESRY